MSRIPTLPVAIRVEVDPAFGPHSPRAHTHNLPHRVVQGDRILFTSQDSTQAKAFAKGYLAAVIDLAAK